LSLGIVTLQALALPFKASKWKGQGLECQGQGQGLTSLILSQYDAHESMTSVHAQMT